jgi:hypothetical protein
MCGYRHVNNKPPCFDVLCSWLWRIWQLPNIDIHYVVPLFVEVVIDIKFRGLNQEIMFTYNRQHQLFWMWLEDILFYVCKRFYLLELLLEGWDGQTWKNHVRNCAPCLLPNVDGQIDLYLIMVLTSLQYMLYGQSLGTTIMLICDNCYRGWHMGCLMPPLEKILIGKWFYPWCP